MNRLNKVDKFSATIAELHSSLSVIERKSLFKKLVQHKWNNIINQLIKLASTKHYTQVVQNAHFFEVLMNMHQNGPRAGT